MAAVKYAVCAEARDGFDHYWRADTHWPRGNGPGREVLVVDSDEDPPGRQIEGMFAIGRKSFAVLQADPRIFIRTGEDPQIVADENAALRARVADLEAQLAAAGGGKKK